MYWNPRKTKCPLRYIAPDIPLVLNEEGGVCQSLGKVSEVETTYGEVCGKKCSILGCTAVDGDIVVALYNLGIVFGGEGMEVCVVMPREITASTRQLGNAEHVRGKLFDSKNMHMIECLDMIHYNRGLDAIHSNIPYLLEKYGIIYHSEENQRESENAIRMFLREEYSIPSKDVMKLGGYALLRNFEVVYQAQAGRRNVQVKCVISLNLKLTFLVRHYSRRIARCSLHCLRICFQEDTELMEEENVYAKSTCVGYLIHVVEMIFFAPGTAQKHPVSQ